MKKINLLAGVALAGLLFVNGQSAFAADTATEKTTKAEVEVTKSGAVDPGEPEEPIGPGTGTGDFTINAVSDFAFGQIKIGEVGTATVATDKKLGIEVADNRGTGAGWNVQVAMTNFSSTIDGNTDTIVKGWKLEIPKGTVTSKAGDLANAPETSAVTLDTAGTAQNVFSAAKDKGLGRYTNVFMDDKTAAADGVRLTIPSYAKVGKYKADLTWTLANAPVK
ncbi:WxL domain-containing protein [Enterococcus quebecensis]|uniref:WxL domain-containing protein n=1 Tax=Enterococcus quebecensis TaxID=903983 RepID=A0A1E5GUX7_9ENTE|nr:WxL domain-containing protein [Enterococcus quebecensis]OEG16504.1 hypothetical protein BCR23_06340 [Enterococcus quebecensis]OJG74122.1 hypothetical protein RV12_GL002760 [Enterococcus quebecensis]